MSIKIEMLRCFAAVAESGNLVDAAERLNRSPSAVSMTLKQLEEHLGKPLFETDRKNKLSPVGSFVLEQAQREVLRFDRAVQNIESFARAAVGNVRIAAVPSVASSILPLALRRFMTLHPNVQIDLRDMDSPNVLHALEHQDIDIGIATAPEHLQTDKRIPLFTDTFGLVCSSDHKLAQSTEPISWAALKQETFIANELCRSIEVPEFQEIINTAQLNVHNTVSLLAMIKANLGVTVLPKMVIKLYPQESVFRPVEDAKALRQIDLLYRSGNTTSPVAEVVGEFIVQATRDVIGE